MSLKKINSKNLISLRGKSLSFVYVKRRCRFPLQEKRHL